jgi:hypothetical protein
MGNGITKVRIISKKDNISQGFPADGQWDTSDQLSTISEVTQPFHFQMSHMNHADSGDWKQYSRNYSDLYSVGEGVDMDDDDEDNDSAPIKKVSVPPLHPLSTPTTASSSTIEADSSYGSQLAQLKMMAASNGHHGVDDLTNDDMSLSDEASLSSAHQRLLAGSSSSSLRRRTLPGLPRANTTASPEMRNKMRYFMGKYKHQHGSDDHGSQLSAATATTTASSST